MGKEVCFPGHARSLLSIKVTDAMVVRDTDNWFAAALNGTLGKMLFGSDIEAENKRSLMKRQTIDR